MGRRISGRIRAAILMGYASCSSEELAKRFDLPQEEIQAIWNYARRQGLMPEAGDWPRRRRRLFMRGSHDGSHLTEMMAEVRAWHKPTVTKVAA